MTSLKKTKSLIFFLLINIVCITCPPTFLPEGSALERCTYEIFYEFRYGTTLDDFLHSFLYIKYNTVFWNKETNINEQIFYGKKKLKDGAKAYYFELYYTSQDMDLPMIPSPKDFCKSEYRREQTDCKRNIAAIGCKVDVSGNICFRHMFIHWKKRTEPGTAPGTEDLSDIELFQAISKGTRNFNDVSPANLSERLSDEMLLEDFYSDNEDRRQLMEQLRHSRTEIESLYYSSSVEERRGFNDECSRIQIEHYNQETKDLHDARFRVYGNGDLPYAYIYNEYIRRQTVPKPYAKYYAMHIYNKLKSHPEMFEVDNRFKSREEYCQKYLDQQSNLSNLYNFSNLYI